MRGVCLALAALVLAGSAIGRADGAVQAQPAAPAVARAEDQAEPRPTPPGTILIFFRGGQAGQNMAAVLAQLLEQPGLVPREERTISPGDTICDLLSGKGLLAPCEAFFPIVRRLNPGLNVGAPLSVGQQLVLPAMEVRRRRSGRTVDLDIRTVERIARNWATFQAIAFPVRDQARLEYDTIEMRVRASDPGQLEAVTSQLVALELANVSFETVRFETIAAQPYARPEQEVRTQCTSGQLQTNPVSYHEYVFEDDPPQPTSSPTLMRPTVFILDVPLIDTANLRFPVQVPAGWACQWVTYAPGQHATHLAGIIASRDPTFGIVGLEPSAIVLAEPYIHVGAPPPAGTLQKDISALLGYPDLFHEAENFATLPVFLVASSFRNTADYGTRLTSAASRFNGPNSFLEASIQDEQPLLVVAAGQDPSLPGGMELDARTPLSPQNLGDLPNVITVTACERCTRRGADLRDDANYDTRREFVHVAAPGGPIVSWVDNGGIASASGTSQAAAFAAGVAARMIGLFPNRYRSADRIKVRLQATSFPLIGPDGEFLPESERRLAAGIVDPEVAFLDPALDWVKDTNGWRSVRVRRWSASSARFRPHTRPEWDRELGAMARLVQTSPLHFVGYREPLDDDGAAADSSVLRALDLGSLLDSDHSLILCDGSSIRLGDVLDFVPRLGGIPRRQQDQDRACAAN